MAEAAATTRDRDRVNELGGRKAIRAALRVVAAVVLLELAVLAAWWWLSAWRLGRVVLTNNGPPLKVQVLGESGDEPIGEPVDLVANSTLSLPDGDYRLRVTGVGRIGRIYRFAVNRGETVAHRLSLQEGCLLGRDREYTPADERYLSRKGILPYATVTRAMELSTGKADLVEYDGETVVRRDGATGKPVWDTSRPRLAYGPRNDPSAWLRWIHREGRTIRFIEPAPDLDRDGIGDVLLVVVESNAFLALSGKDGSMLWNHVAEKDSPGGPWPEGPDLPGPIPPDIRPIAVIGQPALGDVDGDGVPDIIATMAFEKLENVAAKSPSIRFSRKPHGETFDGWRVVEAISGRSGRRLWVYPIDPERAQGNHWLTFRPWHNASLVRGRRSLVVAVGKGQQWIGLDPATGRPRSGPIELGFEPEGPIQHADLDGDGQPEILALQEITANSLHALAVFSMDTGQVRWTARIAAFYPSAGYHSDIDLDWPWIVDLDGDGRSEVVVPDAGPIGPKPGYRGIRLLDGASGQTRWVRPMNLDISPLGGAKRFLEAPDLDGDGVRDLLVFSWCEERDPFSLRDARHEARWQYYIDALSGRDGHPLWDWHVDLPEGKSVAISNPRWWGRGPDGWPLLAVPVDGIPRERREEALSEFSKEFLSQFEAPPVLYVLEASTGRVVSEAPGLLDAGVADLDGDGLDDLWSEAGGQLHAFRGEPPEVWRALGRFLPNGAGDPPRPGEDLDGDGIGDTLVNDQATADESSNGPSDSLTALARSGRDGHLLWKTALDPPGFRFGRDRGNSRDLIALPLPAGDLDGDGTSDVLVVSKLIGDAVKDMRRVPTLPVQVLSGRSGRLLWTAGSLPQSPQARGLSQIVWVEAHAIGPKESPDLIVRHHSPNVFAGATMPPDAWPAEDHLARVSGRTGRILWDVPLDIAFWSPGPGDPPIAVKCEDLDGDGSLEAVLMVAGRGGAGPAVPAIKAISLRDGKDLWSRPLDDHRAYIPFQLGRRRGDGRIRVFVAEMTADFRREMMLHALDGRDGTIRWTWRSGYSKGPYYQDGRFDLINLDGDGKDSVCLSLGDYGNARVVILDAEGRQRATRTLTGGALATPAGYPQTAYVPTFVVDLDGDGRDELVTWYDMTLHGWGRDLKDMWSRPKQDWPLAQPLPTHNWKLERILQSWPGPPLTLFVPPATAIDGRSGQVRWAYHLPASWSKRSAVRLLEPGKATRKPLLVSAREDTTVCRQALPTTPRGDYLPPTGALVPPGLARDDPRWTRPFPWTRPVLRAIEPAGLLAAIGLALVNVVLPIGLLRLAARRRPWGIRLLMALPVAAALPLAAFLAFAPLIPADTGPLPPSAGLLFALGTAAGLPILTCAAVAGWSLVRLRWIPMACLAGLTVLASAAIAATWLLFDSRAMPVIEHYGRSGWYLVVVPGAYAAGVLILIAWPLRRAYRWLKRPLRPATPAL